MKNAVSTSVKTSNFKNSIKDRLSSKGLNLLILAFLTFAIPQVKAQQTTDSDVPTITLNNESDYIDVLHKVVLDAFTIRGTVFDEENLPLGGVNVVLKGTKEGTVTDFDGTFEFPRTLEVGEILVFSYLGYDSKEYTVEESESDVIDITISFDASDIILMGAVEVEGVYTSKRNIFQKVASLFKK